MQLFDSIASVLLYALMCCIYATLFGVVVYFCPRLITLLRPSLVRHRALAARLVIATVVSIFVFATHAINYARLVVAPPRKVYWWWQYGAYQRQATKLSICNFFISPTALDFRRARVDPCDRLFNCNASQYGQR